MGDIIYNAESSDICIIGAGHAGCEAALASARMGMSTMLFSMNLDFVAMMPCNPNIGGSSKGHLVREIDALGGEMGRNIDKTFIQSRMLNRGKGPAVHSLRAQADKRRYSDEMKKVLEAENNLHLVQDEIVDMLIEGGRLKGLVGQGGAFYVCRAAVIAAGTYFNSRILYGETLMHCGPGGLKSSSGLSERLKSLGVTVYRFKTGTPARVDRKSVDFSKMEVQDGEEPVTPFSFENENRDMTRKQLPCYLTYTNEATHEIIRANLHRSPMYTGVIEGAATRYCPSIEDKVIRFADKERHQVFVEPEGEDTDEMYVQGMSTSLPESVQKEMYRTIPGLESCRFIRSGYAIEYDAVDPVALKPTLEFKAVEGLFSAGQLSGSSGYEEAAAQGIMAGINAARLVQGLEGVVLDRSSAYIGVLIDDLVTKGTKEPYRMLTSRAEYRLLLRQDNADMRLTPLGYELGLIPERRYESFSAKKTAVKKEIARLEEVILPPVSAVNELLKKESSAEIISGIRLSELIKRPELDYEKMEALDRSRPPLNSAVKEQVNIQIKYKGYIDKQLMQVAKFKRMEEDLLPKDMDYNEIKGLRLEAKQKLVEIMPLNIGQASRISGVTPADVSVIMVFMASKKGRRTTENA